MNEVSDFNLIHDSHSDPAHLVHDGKYFLLSKVKRDHRWEILKSIQEKEKYNPVCIRSIQKEFEIGSQLQHHGIVHYYNYDKAKNQLYREFINGKTWLEFFQKNKEDRYRLKHYTLQLLEIIHYLHINGVYHMDIKSENIIISHDTKQIKLIDFGHSVESNSTISVGGTKKYQPEKENCYGHNDIFAFGKLLDLTAEIPDLKNKTWIKNLSERCMQSSFSTSNAIQLKVAIAKWNRFRLMKQIFTFPTILLLFIIYWNASSQESVKKNNKPSIHSDSIERKVQSVVPESTLPIRSDKKSNKSNTYHIPVKKSLLTFDDSIIILENTKNFGPDFESAYNQFHYEQSTYEIYTTLLENYYVKWKDISVRWVDTIQKTKAKDLYDKELMLSLRPFIHLL